MHYYIILKFNQNLIKCVPRKYLEKDTQINQKDQMFNQYRLKQKILTTIRNTETTDEIRGTDLSTENTVEQIRARGRWLEKLAEIKNQGDFKTVITPVGSIKFCGDLLNIIKNPMEEIKDINEPQDSLDISSENICRGECGGTCASCLVPELDADKFLDAVLEADPSDEVMQGDEDVITVTQVVSDQPIPNIDDSSRGKTDTQIPINTESPISNTPVETRSDPIIGLSIQDDYNRMLTSLGVPAGSLEISKGAIPKQHGVLGKIKKQQKTSSKIGKKHLDKRAKGPFVQKGNQPVFYYPEDQYVQTQWFSPELKQPSTSPEVTHQVMHKSGPPESTERLQYILNSLRMKRNEDLNKHTIQERTQYSLEARKKGEEYFQGVQLPEKLQDQYWANIIYHAESLKTFGIDPLQILELPGSIGDAYLSGISALEYVDQLTTGKGHVSNVVRNASLFSAGLSHETLIPRILLVLGRFDTLLNQQRGQIDNLIRINQEQNAKIDQLLNVVGKLSVSTSDKQHYQPEEVPVSGEIKKNTPPVSCFAQKKKTVIKQPPVFIKAQEDTGTSESESMTGHIESDIFGLPSIPKTISKQVTKKDIPISSGVLPSSIARRPRETQRAFEARCRSMGISVTAPEYIRSESSSPSTTPTISKKNVTVPSKVMKSIARQTKNEKTSFLEKFSHLSNNTKFKDLLRVLDSYERENVRLRKLGVFLSEEGVDKEQRDKLLLMFQYNMEGTVTEIARRYFGNGDDDQEDEDTEEDSDEDDEEDPPDMMDRLIYHARSSNH